MANAFLGGMALQKRLGRRIALAVIIASALVLLGSSILHAGARPTVLSLLFVNAAAIAARLFVARSTFVHVISSSDGVLVTRGRTLVRFIPYEEISTIVDQRADVCLVLRQGGMLRLGIDGDDADRIETSRTLRAMLSRAGERSG